MYDYITPIRSYPFYQHWETGGGLPIGSQISRVSRQTLTKAFFVLFVNECYGYISQTIYKQAYFEKSVISGSDRVNVIVDYGLIVSL